METCTLSVVGSNPSGILNNMENLQLQWSVKDLRLDVDAVLRGQGADPAVIRDRKPVLADIAARALEMGKELLSPQVFMRELKVSSFKHQKLTLEDGLSLTGNWITSQLAPTESVFAILCTIGDGIEKEAQKQLDADMLLGFALDGVGSAGVEALAQLVCRNIEEKAVQADQRTTVPFSPGMINWSVDEGQPFIFDMLASVNDVVTLSPSLMMSPRKSLSMLVGVGRQLDEKGTTCDYCAMQGTCKYRQYGGHVQAWSKA